MGGVLKRKSRQSLAEKSIPERGEKRSKKGGMRGSWAEGKTRLKDLIKSHSRGVVQGSKCIRPIFEGPTKKGGPSPIRIV